MRNIAGLNMLLSVWDAVPAVLDDAPSHPIDPPRRGLPMNSPALYPQFGAAIPVLKEMLVLSRSTDGRAQ
jgi:hypothetical protein